MLHHRGAHAHVNTIGEIGGDHRPQAADHAIYQGGHHQQHQDRRQQGGVVAAHHRVEHNHDAEGQHQVEDLGDEAGEQHHRHHARVAGEGTTKPAQAHLLDVVAAGAALPHHQHIEAIGAALLKLG